MSLLPKHPLVRFFASFGLATTTLIFLLIITFLGTVEQTEHGLFESQAKYFESWFVTSIDMACVLRAMHVSYQGSWDLPILMPGGLLSMIVLSVNLLVGGILRFEKELKWLLRLCTFKFSRPVPHRIGILISHMSIVFMLLAGLVSMLAKKDGAMGILQGSTADEFQSFHDSVIEIEKLKPASVKRSSIVIDGDMFKDLKSGKGRTFTHKELPFEIMIYNYAVNAAPLPARDQEVKNDIIDGYYIQEMKEQLEQEKNADAAYAKITLKDGTSTTGILWRHSVAPFTVKAGDAEYGITLTRRAWKLPFAVRLDKFIHEVHAGTSKARKFTANVAVIETNGTEHKRPITMNDPLRRDGYALFQSSFDPGAEADGRTPSTTLQVVRNPSDHWPLISCIAAGIGMLIHFVWSLVRFSDKMRVREEAKAV
jgi:hypothetical protein